MRTENLSKAGPRDIRQDKDRREKKNRGTVQEKQRETLERMKTKDGDRDR
jgi:hypothetical protein